MIMLAAILNFAIRIGAYFINYIFIYLLLSSVHSEKNENFNFNDIFEYDNSVMLIRAVLGVNKHRKYIQRD